MKTHKLYISQNYSKLPALSWARKEVSSQQHHGTNTASAAFPSAKVPLLCGAKCFQISPVLPWPAAEIWDVCTAPCSASLPWGWRQTYIYGTRNPCSTSLWPCQILESQGFPDILASHTANLAELQKYKTHIKTTPVYFVPGCLQMQNRFAWELPSRSIWDTFSSHTRPLFVAGFQLPLILSLSWSFLHADTNKQGDVNWNYKFMLVYLSSSS